MRSTIAWLLLLLASSGNDQLGCNGLQFQPLEIYGGEECALILDGPGRTSVYDYTYNLLRGSFPAVTGGQTCITYDAVNRAYVEARKRINVAQPKTEVWKPEELASVGELLLDISINLAQTYGLSYEEVEKSLPLIDTSKTLIREVCPAFLSNVECRPGKYRRYDGLCTNLENPSWGATLSPFARLMPPRFADGMTAPRISITGRDLPLSRVVSRTMHPDEGYHDHAGTVMVIAWGQFMDHDYTLTGTPLDPRNRNDPEECCHRPPHLKNPYCNEILIPEDDYFYRMYNVKCMDFVRAFPAVRPGCRLGSRVPFNLLTGVLDGNTVYGISEDFARKLRTGYGGLLRMNPVFSEYGLKDLLPLKLDIPDEGCTRPNKSMYCFEAGEIRVNEQLVLTCMHTLMAREHNRLAKGLAQVNPHWDDETLYQEARRIVIAEIQHVTYNEFLPILLGKDVMQKFGLLLEKNGYWNGYDPNVNPGVIDAFASAAFRFGHSLLPTAVERWSKAHKFIASKRLSDLIRRPYDLYRAGVFDEYLMGLMNQVAQAMDDSITQEVTNHLFKKVGAKFGMDLVSFNMQRGREFGIPSYMDFRKYCGLPQANTFEELFGSMPNETIRRYSSIFEHPADVDLWSGGVSERPLPGSMLGPTFACVIATQFSNSRRGDRFWYELPNQPSSFTLDQLNEIKKIGLARLICDNTDLIDTIQIYPMVLPDHEINPRVPCRSGILPSIDLSKWAEFPTSSRAAQYKLHREESNAMPVDLYENIYAYSKLSDKAKKRMNDLKSGPLPSVSGQQFLLNLWPFNQVLGPKFKNRNIFKKYSTPIKLRDMIVQINSKRIIRNLTDVEHVPSVQELMSSNIKFSIVESLRDRRKNVENDLPDERSLNLSSRPGETSPLAKKRLKRSTEASGGKVGPKIRKSRKYLSKRENLYRHPELSVEEQTRQKENSSDLTLLAPFSPSIEDNTQLYKRIWNIINNTRGGILSSKAPSNKEQKLKRRYTPVLKGCNDTTEVSASEVDDLNFRPKKPKYQDRSRDSSSSTEGYNEESESPETLSNVGTRYGRLVDRDPSPFKPRDIYTTEPPPFEANKTRTYINVPDYPQYAKIPRNPAKSNSSDIPAYNPANIPYVEVPDYSDQREESLDKEDQSSRKGSYEDYGDSDVIDPEPDLQPNKEYSGSNGSSNLYKVPAVEKPSEGGGVSDENNHFYLKKSDDAASKDAAAAGAPRYKHSKDTVAELSHEVKSANHNASSTENTSSGEQKPKEKVVVDEEKADVETKAKVVEATEEPFEFEPFDINEYKKPFDLDDFFKNDPLFKSLRLSDEESQIYDKEPTKVIPVHEDELSKSDGFREDDDFSKRFSRYHRKYEDDDDDDGDGDGDDGDGSNEDNSDFASNDKFDSGKYGIGKYRSDESRNPEIIKENLYRYGDTDFFRPFVEDVSKEAYEDKFKSFSRENSSEETTDDKPINYSSSSSHDDGNYTVSEEDSKPVSEDYREEPDDKSSDASNLQDHTESIVINDEEVALKESSPLYETIVVDNVENVAADVGSTYTSGNNGNYSRNDPRELYKGEKKSAGLDPSDDTVVIEAKEEDSSSDAITEDEYRKGDKEFFKPIFGEKIRSTSEPESEQITGEKDFLSNYFSKDVAKRLRESLDDVKKKEEERELVEKKHKDALESLSTILHKKDHVSRFDESIDKKMKDGGKSPARYKNFWTLEYAFPVKLNETESKGEKD